MYNLTHVFLLEILNESGKHDMTHTSLTVFFMFYLKPKSTRIHWEGDITNSPTNLRPLQLN